jgi:hypothetical protein
VGIIVLICEKSKDGLQILVGLLIILVKISLILPRMCQDGPMLVKKVQKIHLWAARKEF